MISWLIKKVIGSKNARLIKTLHPLAAEINTHDEAFKKLSDDQLKALTTQFKAEVAGGKSLDDMLVPAFAAAR